MMTKILLVWMMFLAVWTGACDAAIDEGAFDEVPADDLAFEEGAYSYSGGVAATLATGGSKTVAVSVTGGEVLVVHVVPSDDVGDVDVFLYDGDPNAFGSTARLLQSSTRARGYVDGFFRPRPAGGAVTLHVKMKCLLGPCNFTSFVGVGDSTTFRVGGLYLNQRSFTQKSGKCKGDGGVTYADGECMCSDAAAAMKLVLDGRRPVSQLRSAAQDLFDRTNNAGGAANRSALMQRLRDVYGYSSCWEVPYSSSMFSTLQSELRAGSMVMLRSQRFTPAGHWVLVEGTETVNGRKHVRVHDPFGRWSAAGYTRNSTDAGSATGRDVSYDYLDVSGATSSLVICR